MGKNEPPTDLPPPPPHHHHHHHQQHHHHLDQHHERHSEDVTSGLQDPAEVQMGDSITMEDPASP